MSSQQLSLIDLPEPEEPDDGYVIPESWGVVDGKPNSWVYVKRGNVALSTAYRANQVPVGGLFVMRPRDAEQLGRALVYWARAVRSAS